MDFSRDPGVDCHRLRCDLLPAALESFARMVREQRFASTLEQLYRDYGGEVQISTLLFPTKSVYQSPFERGGSTSDVLRARGMGE